MSVKCLKNYYNRCSSISSVIESTDCSSKEWRIKSHHPCGSSQLSVTPRSDTFTQTYMQTKHQCTKTESKLLKRKNTTLEYFFKF